MKYKWNYIHQSKGTIIFVSTISHFTCTHIIKAIYTNKKHADEVVLNNRYTRLVNL